MSAQALTFRAVKVERADSESRILEVAFASDAPVHRGRFVEVLDMRALDTSRLNEQAPLLINHDPDRQVGGVVRGTARVDGDGIARAKVKFSRSQVGTDAFRDAEDGLLGVSFGYVPGAWTSAGTDESGTEIRKFQTTAFEISLVSTPADVSVGVGRTLVSNSNIMNSQNNDVSAEQTRASEILGLATRHKVPLKDAQRFIAGGKSVDDFRGFILENIGNAKPIATTTAFTSSIGHEFHQHVSRSNYSFLRALAVATEGGTLDGIEREAHDELVRRSGGRAKGVMVPLSVLVSRAVNTTVFTEGTPITGTQVLGGELIQALRPVSRVVGLGARVMTGLGFNATIPKIVEGSAATWKAEMAQADQTQPTFGQISLTKHCITAYAEVSKELIVGEAVDAEALIRDDLAAAIGTAIDRAAIQGTGASGEPTGILNITGFSTVTFGAAPSWAKVVEFETTLADDDADVEGARIGWLTTPTVRGKWKTTQKVTGEPAFLIDDQGRANTYPVAVSTNMPSSNKVIFGNWRDLIIASFDGLDVVVDPFTNARKRIVNITASQLCDLAVRHPESFVVSTDSGAQ